MKKTCQTGSCVSLIPRVAQLQRKHCVLYLAYGHVPVSMESAIINYWLEEGSMTILLATQHIWRMRYLFFLSYNFYRRADEAILFFFSDVTQIRIFME